MNKEMMALARGHRFTSDFSGRTRLIMNGRKRSDPCNSMLYRDTPERSSLIVVFGRRNTMKDHRDDYGRHNKFLEWMLKASPWAPVFLTKHAPTVSAYGAEVDVDKDLFMVHSAATALRCGVENPLVPAMFEMLVEEGVEHHLAFMAAYHTSGHTNNVTVARNSHSEPFEFGRTSPEEFRGGFNEDRLKRVSFRKAAYKNGNQPYHGVGECFKKGGVGDPEINLMGIGREALTSAAVEVRNRAHAKKKGVAYKNPFGNAGVRTTVPAKILAKHFAIKLKEAFPDA